MYIALSIIAALAVLVFILSPRGLQSLYSGLIFAPTKATGPYDRPTFQGITPRDVWLRSSLGRRIHGWFFLNPASDVVIICSHGNAGNVEEWSTLAGEHVETGASVLLYDYQGYGLSQGKATIRGACRDGLVAYDYVTRELGFAPEKVIMHGVSLGSGVACDVASKRTVGAIILHGAFSSLRLVSAELLPITRHVPGFLFFRPSMDNAARLGRISVPLRLVHGEYDELFGRHHPNALLAASSSQDKSLTVLPGCVHSERDPQHQQIVREVVEALSQPSRA